MGNRGMKKWWNLHIFGVSLAIFPTLLLLWVIVDLILFLMIPWQFAGDFNYPVLKQSVFWMELVGHCEYLEAKWITSVVWHFSWLWSLTGIMIITKIDQKSTRLSSNPPIYLENVNNTPENGKLSRLTLHTYINTIQLILLIVGTFVVRFKKGIFFRSSGDPILENIVFFLVILPPFSILPQYFLSKILFRRTFQKLKGDYGYIALTTIGLFISFFNFGRTLLGCA